MTRFIMSIQQATKLVIDSAMLARGGEVFITKMAVARIEDLARVMIDELADHFGYSSEQIKMITIGSKPGEKLYEELMSLEEMRRALELQKYFSVLPAFRGLYTEITYDYQDIVSTAVGSPYVSSKEEPLSIDCLRSFMIQNNLLFEDLDAVRHPSERYWPGDKEAN